MNSVSTFWQGSKLIGHLRLRQFGAHVHTGNDVLDRSTLHTVVLTFAVNRKPLTWTANLWHELLTFDVLDCIDVLDRDTVNKHVCVVALTFFRCYKRSDLRFCACAIFVKSSICSEMTKHVWHKYYRLFVMVYITSQQKYLSQINTRQTSFEAYLDRKRKWRHCCAP